MEGKENDEPEPRKEETELNQINIEYLNQYEKEYDRSIKLILLGDSSVGKTSFLNRITKKPFNSNTSPTIALQHYNVIIKINSLVLRIQIWDTAGQEKFNSITSTYYKSTDVVLFIYSIDNKESFNRIPEWIKEFDSKNTNTGNEEQKMLKILIGNKKDLENTRKISYEEGKNLSEKNEFSFFSEISCKDEEDEKNNENIDKIVKIIGEEFYKIFESSKGERLNSSSYLYEASQSVLGRKKKKCFC